MELTENPTDFEHFTGRTIAHSVQSTVHCTVYSVQCTVRTLTDANKGELFLGCQSIRAGQAALF